MGSWAPFCRRQAHSSSLGLCDFLRSKSGTALPRWQFSLICLGFR